MAGSEELHGAAYVFADEAGVMNRSVTVQLGRFTAVSQFTLTASTRKGNRRAISVRRVTAVAHGAV